MLLKAAYRLEQKIALNQRCFYPGCFTQFCCCLEMLLLQQLHAGSLPALAVCTYKAGT